MITAERGLLCHMLYTYVRVYVICRLKSNVSVADQSGPEACPASINYGKEAKLLLGLIMVMM